MCCSFMQRNARPAQAHPVQQHTNTHTVNEITITIFCCGTNKRTFLSRTMPHVRIRMRSRQALRAICQPCVRFRFCLCSPIIILNTTVVSRTDTHAHTHSRTACGAKPKVEFAVLCACLLRIKSHSDGLCQFVCVLNKRAKALSAQCPVFRCGDVLMSAQVQKVNIIG